MAQIDYDKVRIIVENNLRNAGLQGVFENGWKEVITIDNQNYPQQFNLQNLRDVIAKSIVDALTDPTVDGTYSTGNIQGNPSVSTNTSEINITLDSTLASKNAVRVGDETEINSVTDPKFVAWMAAVDAFIATCVGVTGPTQASLVGTASATYSIAGVAVGGFPPSTATGETTTGSDTVKIGD